MKILQKIIKKHKNRKENSWKIQIIDFYEFRKTKIIIIIIIPKLPQRKRKNQDFSLDFSVKRKRKKLRKFQNLKKEEKLKFPPKLKHQLNLQLLKVKMEYPLENHLKNH